MKKKFCIKTQNEKQQKVLNHIFWAKKCGGTHGFTVLVLQGFILSLRTMCDKVLKTEPPLNLIQSLIDIHKNIVLKFLL